MSFYQGLLSFLDHIQCYSDDLFRLEFQTNGFTTHLNEANIANWITLKIWTKLSSCLERKIWKYYDFIDQDLNFRHKISSSEKCSFNEMPWFGTLKSQPLQSSTMRPKHSQLIYNPGIAKCYIGEKKIGISLSYCKDTSNFCDKITLKKVSLCILLETCIKNMYPRMQFVWLRYIWGVGE